MTNGTALVTTTMRAARLGAGATSFSVESVARPTAGEHEVVVRVHACGICGSDLHIIDGLTPTAFRPITLGHEPAGVVAELGRSVDGLRVGEHVFINPLLVCGDCEYCRRGRPQICARRELLGIHRDGALAEYVVVPATNVVPLPDEIGLLEAAIIESASTPYHALRGRAPVGRGDRVAVIGVGGIGIHGVQIARILGAEQVVAVDVSDGALRRALALGATDAVDGRGHDVVGELRSLSGGGVDVALECVGLAQTCQWAISALRPGGIAALAGIGSQAAVLPPTAIFARGECEVRGVYTYGPEDVAAVITLIATGQLDARAAISGTYPLERINEGLERFRSATDRPVRVLITP